MTVRDVLNVVILTAAHLAVLLVSGMLIVTGATGLAAAMGWLR